LSVIHAISEFRNVHILILIFIIAGYFIIKMFNAKTLTAGC